MATRIKASPVPHFFDEPAKPDALLAAIAIAPIIGFVLSPSFHIGRLIGTATGYVVAMGICFLGALLISMNRHGVYKRP
jgi:hypothetical protein